MIDLYTWATPNGHKASIMLEECGFDYEVRPVNIGKGEQNQSDFLAINPNGKIPAIVDKEEDITVFESGAILVYLAEKTGKFLPAKGAQRAEVMSWLNWQMANLGPIMGQAYHFYTSAPRKIGYAIDRYRNESIRLLSVMENRLSQSQFLGGDEYSIADIASFSWAKAGHAFLSEATDGALPEMTHLKQWFETISARPGVQRGVSVPAT